MAATNERTSNRPSPEAIAAQIRDLFLHGGGADYVGEPVTQQEHALQCAQLAEQAGADLPTVVAAFLHDIGHLLPGQTATDYMAVYGRMDHETLGAVWLEQRGFTESVTQLIRQHVNAKRYLTFKYPAYLANLSDASRQTLTYQGGPMTAGEARTFEANSYFQQIIQVRRWDEAAKRTNHTTPGLEHYVALVAKVLHV
ncbi:HD domain-containing protein [Fibrella aquatilis]|uniref:HD domain-containing protein n=1 Tax=Fibrella aquatilis TaxID=2817059 RepID=A0A939G2S8_9BACT|nr:HD domain-containing protein [Fibrella aquatilis]MBO0929579.1 HD domain-containing protein [Fibrella aquatilis]